MSIILVLENPLTNDVVMQLYFTREGNEEQLRQFIKAVTHLTDDDLYILEIKKPKLSKENVLDKDFIVDINVTSKTGHRVNIEMQVENHAGFIERMVSYNARQYSSQLQRGDKYKQLKEAISIVVVDFPIFNDTAEFYEHILFRRINRKIFTKAQQFYIIDLTKIPKELTDAKTMWATLFKARSREELEMLSQDCDEMKQAADKLAQLAADEDARFMADLRERGRWAREQREFYLLADERAKMEAKAEAEKLESAKKFLQNGISLDIIADSLKLSEKSIEKLKTINTKQID